MGYTKYVTRTVLAHHSNYGGYRTEDKIKYIVIHYTANDGDTDEANAKYFSSPNRKASAHFFCDDDSTTLTVPLNRVAWHCGGSLYNDCNKTGGGKLYKKVTNTNSIGIEMCDTNRNGSYGLSVKTRQNVIKLVRALMEDYNIDINHVVRHFDVNGKHCPVYFMDEEKWNEFKAEILNEDNKETDNVQDVQNSTTSSTSTTSSKQAGTQSDVPFRVKVLTDLNIRVNAGTQYRKVGTIKDKGVYTITEVKGHWGKLKSGLGYISILNAYVKRL